MDDNIITIEESFKLIPEEVQSYIYGNVFTEAFKTLCDEKGLSEDDRTALETMLFGYLAQIETEESLLTLIKKISRDDATTQYIINWIITTVTNPIFSLLVNKEAEESEEIDTETKTTPSDVSPLQALSSIKERMTQASTIAPTKRDYSIQKPELLEALTETKKRRQTDPYREHPE